MCLSIKINNVLSSKDKNTSNLPQKRRILSLEERESATKKARTVVAVEEEVTNNESANDEIECHEDEDD